jgi:CMP-N,N'-diacetyllegionaminic acid synthase
MAGGRVLAVVTARGGSKGVPRKNVREVGGKPLIAYTLEAARAVRHLFHRIVVSTDDPEIADIARQWGGEVPFQRPADLSGDAVPSLPVVQHAVAWVEREEGIRMDWVCLLQPTTPLREPADIVAALRLAEAGGCDSVISVVQVVAGHPMLIKRIENDCLLPYCIEEPEGIRRQDCQPPAYKRNGAIYLTRRDVVMDRGSLWGNVIRPYVMPEQRSNNVDTELDVKLLDLILRERGRGTRPAQV